jgi:hypothetical protein
MVPIPPNGSAGAEDGKVWPMEAVKEEAGQGE